jgi:hypothetical protein
MPFAARAEGLIDVLGADPVWIGWTSAALAASADRDEVAIGPIV